MKVAVLVVSRNRPDLVQALAGWLSRNMSVDHDLVVVEAGTDRDKLTPHTTIHYPDTDFRGKCLAHNLALEHAREQGRLGLPYDYYWVLMNDVVFDEGVDAARVLIETMERNPRLALLSPTCADGQYPGSRRRPGGGWRPVATCDYLGFMLRAEAVEEVGFLNPEFRYCWGAIHELSYHLHHAGWLIGYSDEVTYRHLGGSTYGVKSTNTISREEYQRRAKRFAYAYFAKVYGPGWPRLFWAAVAPGGAEIDTFTQHNQLWASAFEPDELAELTTARPIFVPTTQPKRTAMHTVPHSSTPTNQPRQPLKLHLGCGPEKRAGWVNVDVNPALQPDLVAAAYDLPMLADGSCEVIEACHLFEHLTLTQAKRALGEWRRLLAPGGELRLELPNLDRCVALIGTELDGFDMGLLSLFGYPPAIDVEGEPQLHKWGWTPTTLTQAMQAAGFGTVRQEPVTQTYRKATRFDRDMRLVATVTLTAPNEHTRPRAASPLPALRNTATTSLAAPSAIAVPSSTPETVAFLAWPRYDDPRELDRFFGEFARQVAGHTGVRFVLYHDAGLDPSREATLIKLEASHARTLGAGTALEVDLLDGPYDPSEWRRAGQWFAGRIRLSAEVPPRDALRQVAAPVVDDAEGLRSLLAANGVTSHVETAPEVPARRIDLRARIKALDPWFYPVEIDGIRVEPGVGTEWSAEKLTNRIACRSTLLVEEVLRRVDLRDKSVLELACNCGFWSSFYAQAGAQRVLGVEGRARFVEQAQLFWEHGQFLPRDSYEFIQGDIADRREWRAIEARGDFDVTLCAGILYHVPNYREILKWAASVTREVLIVDTRVQDGEERLEREPGDLAFNAIEATLDKVVPNRARLLATLRELGFEPEVLPARFGPQIGLPDGDSYADGKRITILARKVRVPVSRTRDTVVLGGAR
jgi:SAM-dependent methyltransferase